MQQRVTIFVLGLGVSTPMAQAKVHAGQPPARNKIQCTSLLTFKTIDRALVRAESKRLASLEKLIRSARLIPIFIPAESVTRLRALVQETISSEALESLVKDIFTHTENSAIFFPVKGRIHSAESQAARYVLGSSEIHFEQRLSLFLLATAGMNGLIN